MLDATDAARTDASAAALDRARLSAERAQLNHASDAEPGIRRRRAGRGFSYAMPGGRKVGDAETLARIRSLAIPPAWTDVWIATDADGHIQATGRDVRGRKQYRYHPRWSACRDEVKYASLTAFARSLPALRARVDADLRRRGLPFERVAASIVWLLDHTMIRVGNAVYARDNKSFGLTTLRSRHVAVEGGRITFAFKGKSGKEWKLGLVDRRMARVVRSIQELPGQHLFQYLDDDGARRPVRSQDVNDYIRQAAGPEFSSKHFRTWGGTARMLSVLAATPLPDTKAGARRTLNAAIDEVAGHLGNTRSVCRKCYVHPAVIEAWCDGTLGADLAALAKRRRPALDGLDEEEALVLAFLDARQGLR